MSLNDIVNVSITKQTAAISRTGFGTPMIMSAEADSLLADTAQVFGTDLAELTAAGFSAAGVTAKKFSALLQNPKVDQIIVGKRSLPPLKTVEIVPVAKNATVYRVTIGGVGPLSTSPAEVFEYTSDATATVAEIIAGLVALINAGTQNVLATDVASTSMTIQSADAPGGSATAGVPFAIEVNDRTLLPMQNTTADPGLATDLAAIRDNPDGNDDWYALILDSHGQAEIEAMAALIEPLSKVFLTVTSDADVLTSASDDVGSNLQALNYARTAYVWHQNPDNGAEASWGGKALPEDPGSITWNLLADITGVPATTFTTAELNFLKGKNGNRFVLLGGQTVPQEGKMAGGEFIDITRGIDFITARLQENVFRVLVLSPKVPFTDKGIAIIQNEVEGVMALGISQGIFAADPAPVVTVPRASEVDITDKANRLLPDVNFSATLAGAIHEVEINGVVSV